MTREDLERFAALVAAAERERIIAANAPEIERINAHIKELEAAVAAERRRCAQIARQWDETHPDTNYGGCIARLIEDATP